jgi:hypothetical protein
VLEPGDEKVKAADVPAIPDCGLGPVITATLVVSEAQLELEPL